MPDISKLPELAELFGTTIDALLGRHSPLIEKAAAGKCRAGSRRFHSIKDIGVMV